MADRHHQAAGFAKAQAAPCEHPWWARSFARAGCVCSRCRRRLLPGELVLVEEDGGLRCELCGHQAWARYLADRAPAAAATAPSLPAV